MNQSVTALLKKWALTLLAVWTCVAQAQMPQPPEVAAKSYLLMDVTANQVLAAKDPDMTVEPASLTKLMTAYLVFDALKIDVTSVNYPSGSRAAAAVLAGEVQLGAASYPALKAHVQAGTVRLLGTFGPTRSAAPTRRT
jgi:D-alanyl-D-alanine carboxypeptidase